jgi:hypothetical protein
LKIYVVGIDLRGVVCRNLRSKARLKLSRLVAAGLVGEPTVLDSALLELVEEELVSLGEVEAEALVEHVVMMLESRSSSCARLRCRASTSEVRSSQPATISCCGRRGTREFRCLPCPVNPLKMNFLEGEPRPT